ncbi:hypothetical protein [Vibrio nigripulchritudo]|uniref:hypothetical protein n=1 Tax=Vibrio nigripulchritudo TaxID=28173 RepID=UPI0003B23B6C|nr:hypothetical protein [Vibrio nigripulchritudo]CCN68802.1 exported hypothetical protein [Vibrio nigripulchritudo SFn118]
MKFNILKSSLLVSILTACGGENSVQSQKNEVGDISTPIKGRFVDSPVVNIQYRTETQSGTTDKNGEFLYFSGETVTFSVGDVSLPSTFAKNLVTPLDLAQTNLISDSKVVNIVRFLQTLDEDGNPDNEIYIADDAKKAALGATDVDFEASEEEFASNQTVLNIISHANLATELVARDAALDHFSQQLKNYNVSHGKHIGTWLVENSSDYELLMFSFFENGTYIHTEVGTPSYNTQRKDDEWDGMEYYDYILDSQNYLYPVQKHYDGNGTAGMTHVGKETIKVSFPSESTMSFNISGSGGESIEFSKLNPSGITGTWIHESQDYKVISLTFLSGGQYILAEIASDNSGGMEFGEYNFNTQTKELTSNTIVDKNNHIGLSELSNNGSNQIFVEMNGDLLTLNIKGSHSDRTLVFNRQ